MKSMAKITLSIVVIILVSLVLIFAIYKEKNPKVKNIFDEMYYGEKKVYSWFGETPFWDIPGIHQWNRKDMVYTSMKEDTTVYERYEKKYKTKKIGEWNIRFRFSYDIKEIEISFIDDKKEKKIGIGIFISYKVDTKTAKEIIRFYDNTKTMPEAEIEDVPKIKEYLEKNNISLKDLKETADELLYEKVIGDWEKYAKSRFSKDNLGTVKIERSPLFDGVD